jgi:hypothetical protein
MILVRAFGWVLLALPFFTPGGYGAEKPAAKSLGLTIVDGVLLHDGKPYRGIGVNYFQLFERTLQHPDDTTSLQGLARLAQAGIPFVRFMGCGFWPVEFELYRQDKAAYFQRMDRVIETAEKHHLGLIPSLFWYLATVPDLVGEPLDQLGNPQSKSIAWIRRYTEEMVTRYKDSPAIWGWELGNEYNLAADLPNAAQHRPPVWPNLKTAATRTARDELTSPQMLVVLREFAQTVRKHDPTRIILSGHSLPRSSAFHNTHERSWKEDTLEQFGEILARDNPDPIGILCVHVYPHEKHRYPGGAKNIAELMRILQSFSHQSHKPLFVEEFGAGKALDREQERMVLDELLAAIEREQVPLAAFWSFDLPQQESEGSVSFDNQRAYVLDLLARANRRMQGK